MSSGISEKGNAYGSQYSTLYQSGNIKYVTKSTRDSEPLMETMTEGRVYAVVGGDEVISVIYFDKNNRRAKEIDLTPPAHKSSPERARLYGDYLYKVEITYSTDNRTAKKTGREKDFQYSTDTGYWVIPHGKADNIRILGREKVR